jgi:hypothetical protein
VYDLPVRVSFISSALPDGAATGGLAEFPDGAPTGGLAEVAAARLALFFLGAAGGADEPVFGILFSS